MKKTLLFFFIALSLLVQAQTFTVGGISYSVTTGSNVKVDGKQNYTGALVIPSTVVDNGVTYTVTSIDDYAFSKNTGLTTLTIPNTVTTIGTASFYECSGLTSVTIPTSVTSISDQAFRFCTGITSISIPSSVTSIGSSAFENSGLTSIVIPSSVTTISTGTFSDCYSLTSVTIPSSVTSIADYAFSNCKSLTSVTNMSSSPQNIGADVFAFINLSNISLYVPSGSTTAYSTADVWKDFSSISAINALSTNESNGRSKLQVYPNPTTKEINFSVKENQIVEIYSQEGRLMKTISTQKGNNRIDVSFLMSGNYILKTREGIQKFIKK